MISLSIISYGNSPSRQVFDPPFENHVFRSGVNTPFKNFFFGGGGGIEGRCNFSNESTFSGEILKLFLFFLSFFLMRLEDKMCVQDKVIFNTFGSIAQVRQEFYLIIYFCLCVCLLFIYIFRSINRSFCLILGR